MATPEYINFIQIISYTAAVETGQMEIKMGITDSATNTTKTYYPIYKQNQDEQSSSFIATIPINSIPTKGFVVSYEIRYLGELYNRYEAKEITIYDEDGVELLSDIHGTTLDVKATNNRPAIEKVDLALAKVDVGWKPWSEEIHDLLAGTVTTTQHSGFQFDVYVTKLNTMKSDRDTMECKLFIGDTEIPLYEPNMPAGSPTPSNNPGIDALSTSLIYNFRIRNIDRIINLGPTTYTVKLFYNFDNNTANNKTLYAEYSDTVIFRSILNELAWSNILKCKHPDTHLDALKIFRIPVIDATFYDTYRKSIDELILYEMAQLNDYFLKYRMLSDQVNMKFARTHGVIENLKYNDNIGDETRNIAPYGGWACDLPPTIKLKAYIKKSSKHTAQEIVNEMKQVLLAFLQIRAGFNGSIVRSEISRFLHDTISDLTSVEVLEPTRDIIYLFDPEYHLPKDRNIVMSYVPEFLWVDPAKIFIQVVILP